VHAVQILFGASVDDYSGHLQAEACQGHHANDDAGGCGGGDDGKHATATGGKGAGEACRP